MGGLTPDLVGAMQAVGFDPKRRRRLIYNDDADQQYAGGRYNITDEQSFIDAEFTIYAFSYTGTPLTGAQRIEKAKHSRRRRR